MYSISRVKKALAFRWWYAIHYQKYMRDIRRDISVKKAFLFGSPYHTNVGDNAQTVCAVTWLRKNYPDYKIYECPDKFLIWQNDRLLHRLASFVSKEDLILLHSGYHTTNLYPTVEHIQRETLKLFPDKQVLILPQTVYFTDEQYKSDVGKAYNQHRHTIMLCRDVVSYEIAKEMFPTFHLRLFPDIVTTMIGAKHYDTQRHGVMLCLRSGVESKTTSEQKAWMQIELAKIDTVETGDTDLDLPVEYIFNHREEVVNDYIQSLAAFKVVITDRYHGIIFALAAGTPVLVIPSSDHKVSSGVDWFRTVPGYAEYIQFVPDLTDLPGEVKKIYDTDFDYYVPEYFNTEYYDRLKMYLEGR